MDTNAANPPEPVRQELPGAGADRDALPAVVEGRGGGAGKRSWLARGLGMLFLSVALAVVVFLASPVQEAPFQIAVKTNFLGFAAESEVHLRFSVVDWELRGARIQHPALPAVRGPVVVRPNPQESTAAREPDTLDIWIRKGDEVVLSRNQQSQSPAEFLINLAHPAAVAIQFGVEGSSIEVTDPDGLASVHELTGGIEAEVGGDDRVAATFTVLTTGEDISDRFFVSNLGFGRPGEDGVVRTGVRSGSLYFMYKPLEEIKLFRGTDLRFSRVDAEISAVGLVPEGIEVSGSGSVGNATLHSRSSSESEPRSVMPLRYHWLTAHPLLIVTLAIVGFVAGALGLALTSFELLVGLTNLVRRQTDE